MNIFFRKLIKLGPFRLNLSKGGVGLSAGPKGLKAGINARGGMYIAGGSHGVRFQHAVPTRTRPRNPKEISAAPLALIVIMLAGVVLFFVLFGYFLHLILER